MITMEVVKTSFKQQAWSPKNDANAVITLLKSIKILTKPTSKTHPSPPTGQTREKPLPEAKVLVRSPKPEPKKGSKMSPECSKKSNEIQICFPERFGEPLEGKKTAKMRSKTCPETVASHSQREHLYVYSFSQRTHPESDSEPVNARYRKVKFLLLFTVVLKTSAIARASKD